MDITATAQEGRDAVRSPQTHSQAGPTASTRTKWCPRRVCPRRNHPKPPEASQAGSNAAAKTRLRSGRFALQFAAASVADRLLQHNRPETVRVFLLRCYTQDLPESCYCDLCLIGRLHHRSCFPRTRGQPNSGLRKPARKPGPATRIRARGFAASMPFFIRPRLPF